MKFACKQAEAINSLQRHNRLQSDLAVLFPCLQRRAAPTRPARAQAGASSVADCPHTKRIRFCKALLRARIMFAIWPIWKVSFRCAVAISRCARCCSVSVGDAANLPSDSDRLQGGNRGERQHSVRSSAELAANRTMSGQMARESPKALSSFTMWIRFSSSELVDFVLFQPFVFGRSPKLWKDPLRFDPARWLKAANDGSLQLAQVCVICAIECDTCCCRFRRFGSCRSTLDRGAIVHETC